MLSIIEGKYKLKNLTGIIDLTVIKKGNYFQKFNGRRKKIIK
jgi:hypothetical protein